MSLRGNLTPRRGPLGREPCSTIACATAGSGQHVSWALPFYLHFALLTSHPKRQAAMEAIRGHRNRAGDKVGDAHACSACASTARTSQDVFSNMPWRVGKKAECAFGLIPSSAAAAMPGFRLHGAFRLHCRARHLAKAHKIDA